VTLLAAASGRTGAYAKRLEELVSIDSGSGDRDGLRAMADRVAGFLDEAGMAVSLVPAGGPDAVVGRLRGTGHGRVLLVGHLDTVFPSGTAAARPFTVDASGRARGPGVCDDAGGLLAGVAAVEVLRDLGCSAFGEIVLLATPDEEIGSPGSRELLAEFGEWADVALGLECARADGALVSGRKGVADVAVRVIGRAAHAGTEPGAGVSAALAVARLALAVDRINGRWSDVTVNAGVLRAGERPNVVAAEGLLVAEVRAARTAHFDGALAAIRDLVAAETVDATVTVEAPVPPWTATGGTHRLLARARRVGAGLGVDVRHTVTGGCGDANLLALHCDAVLDGLGPVGGNDHSSDEYLDLASVPSRVALLAGLIATC
jgi:glutamate carboxypeptidase